MTPPIEVVIPTLGGPSLEATIAALNAGTVIPDEIVLCVPEAEARDLRKFSAPNVRVLPTRSRGQVSQRAEGFRQATRPLVLQLDDDLTVAPTCLERLRDSLNTLGRATAVAPSLVDRETGVSLYKKPNRPAWADRIYYALLNGAGGYQAGRVYLSGAAVGIDATAPGPDLREAQWLPGGCVLHYREELVLDAYFPFPGKAFCEDIIHSHLMTSRGVRLFVDVRAECGVESIEDSTFSLGQFRRMLIADFRARRHYLRLASRPSARLYLFVGTRIASYLAGHR
jgi:glycosyltransferase involved in cell wall biosynthesis